jgi:hypothetical protein
MLSVVYWHWRGPHAPMPWVGVSTLLLRPSHFLPGGTMPLLESILQSNMAFHGGQFILFQQRDKRTLTLPNNNNPLQT